MSYVISINCHGQHRRRSIAEVDAEKAKIDTRTTMIERAVIRQDTMVAPFKFIDEIIQENGWQNLCLSHTIYPRLVREFYNSMRITHFSHDGPVLEVTVREKVIQIDLALISSVTDVPVVNYPRIHFPNFVDPPTWDEHAFGFGSTEFYL